MFGYFCGCWESQFIIFERIFFGIVFVNRQSNPQLRPSPFYLELKTTRHSPIKNFLFFIEFFECRKKIKKFLKNIAWNLQLSDMNFQLTAIKKVFTIFRTNKQPKKFIKISLFRRITMSRVHTRCHPSASKVRSCCDRRERRPEKYPEYRSRCWTHPNYRTISIWI